MNVLQKMKGVFLALLANSTMLFAGIPAIPESVSPDGKIHAVMDIDRDPSISPSWKGDNDEDAAQIEITERQTGNVTKKIPYFGDPWSDQRPLREHVSIKWRSDSRAFAVTIHERFYSNTSVYVIDDLSNVVKVLFPSYTDMTGFPEPDVKHLRPRGRATVEGWDKEGRLIYDLFASPLHSFTGNDPLVHRIFLDVTADGMIPREVAHEKGEWRFGDWIPAEAEQAGTGQPATRSQLKSEGSDKPQPESEGRSR